MTHCAKCGAELIGQKKFCSACGAPTTDPRAPSPQAAAIANAPPSSPSPVTRDSMYNAPPVPSVNPFAQTAMPGTHSPVYGPPPASSKPAVSKPDPQVSPLAVSNVMSQRGAFDAAGGAAVQAAQAAQVSSPPPPEASKKIPGTQVMPSVSSPSQVGGAPPPTLGKAPRTQVMPPSVAAPGSVPKMSSSAPSQGVRPPSVPSPGLPFKPPGVGSAPPPQYGAQPAFPQYAPPPPAQTPPQAAPIPPPTGGGPGWGWNAPAGAPPYPPPQAGFAYVPGARVHVAWANGQRYPGTIQQVAGNQCLVVFPDGRQQWVEMTYVSPA